MKIAIRGHESRGKEVIQILESLGGKKLYYLNASDKCLLFFIDDKEYISCIHHESPLVKECFKIYTLEEFEKEFPFKIGDLCIYYSDFLNTEIVVKILGMIIKDDCIMYEVGNKDTNQAHSGTYKRRNTLRPYKEMKEERNITLTLDKAKEWYKKGGELKEIALQAFTEKELNPFPRSWEEFCKQSNPVASWRYNIPIKYEALFKLEQLRDCWRQGWKPNWSDGNKKKFGIRGWGSNFFIDSGYGVRTFLSFPTYELALEFQECFRDLIEKAEDLI